MKKSSGAPLFQSAAKALVLLVSFIAALVGIYLLREQITFARALVALFVFLVAVAIYDLLQKKRTILRNFPIIGHFRYWLELIGPELRQYWFLSDTSEGPFTRLERRTVYALSKRENSHVSFGTTRNLEVGQHLIIEHVPFPFNAPRNGSPGYNPEHLMPCAKILGGWRNRAKKFRPQSAICYSATSFGSIGQAATTAINEGSILARCLHNTGEGGISKYHLRGGQLIYQIGTGYFGCCDAPGVFNFEKLIALVQANPAVKAIEIKLSQGAKPDKGGILLGVKVTQEIAEARGVPVGEDCYSPAGHSAFSNVDELIAFIERIAEATGLPVGIKSAVGQKEFWHELAEKMATSNRGPDFIAIDGGEGGTGAAPLVFCDHVGYPFKDAFTSVYRIFAERQLHEKVFWIGSGKLGLVENAAFAFAMGCDMIAIARTALFSIGCIQAQSCHTNKCPSGIATHSKWLQRGLDPTLKSVRFANYFEGLRENLLAISHACGVPHPSLIRPEQIVFRDETWGVKTAPQYYGYRSGWGLPQAEDCAAIREIMATPRQWVEHQAPNPEPVKV